MIPTLLGRDTVGYQYKLTFHVSVSGTGFHNTNDGPVKVFAYWRTGAYSGMAASAYSYREEQGICLTIAAEGTVIITTDTTSGTQVDFFGVAKQMDTWTSARCLCSSGVQSIPVNASIATKPGIDPPQAEELGDPTCRERFGNPIQVTSGNKYLQRIDSEVPSDLGPSLLISRHFNTFGSGTGMLGPYWRFGLEYRIAVDTSGNVTLTEAEGRTVAFRCHMLVDPPSDTHIVYSPPYGIGYSLDVASNTYTVGRPDNTKLVFIDTGKVDYLEDLAGNRVRAYYSGGVMDSVKNASGRKIVFKYSMGGRVDTIKTASGAMVVRYEYGSLNRLERVVYADGSWEKYIYGDPHLYDEVVIVTDTTSDGQSRHWGYDSTGLAVHFDRGTRKESVTVDSVRVISDTTCALCPDTFRTFVNYGDGQLYGSYDWVWSPDWKRRLVIRRTNSDCSECGTQYGYDANGLTETVTYANGTVDEFSYDMWGNTVTRTIGANTTYGQWTHWTFDPTFKYLPSTEYRQSVAKAGDSASVDYRYHPTGQIDTLIETGWLDSSSQYTYTSTFTYNDSGQITTANGPRTDVSDVTQYAYDSIGDLQYRVQANGDTTEFGQRDELGRRTWVRSPNGDTTRFAWDARGRLTKVVYATGMGADSTAISLGYNVDGQVTSITNLGGSGLTMLHDAAGYLFRLNDIPGSFIRYGYDTLGNPTSEEVYKADSTLRKIETYRYDNKHRLEAVFDPSGDSTKLGYDVVGNLVSLRNALGKTTQYRYDSLGRLTTTVEPLGADSIKTRFEYNTLNLVTKVTDPDNFEYVYRYDDKGRLVYDNSAVTGLTQYRYDAASNLEPISKLDFGLSGSRE